MSDPPDTSEHPNTRAVLLDGLRQGLQARVVQLYMNLSTAGEIDVQKRAKAGLEHAITAYENAWQYIFDMTDEGTHEG